jgi:hypothetical protein
MMKNSFFLLLILIAFSCKEKTNSSGENNGTNDSAKTENQQASSKMNTERPKMTLEQAEKLAQLPLECIGKKFPNKPGQVITSEEDLRLPEKMHPAFYGCFDWHSSVHGHWALVSLLKDFPGIKQADSIKSALKRHLSKENIQNEVAYFNSEENKTFERTYGWAWLLELSAELRPWNDSLGNSLAENLQPLTDKVVSNYKEFLPKLNYPLRVGQHENTAFGLSFAYDYAVMAKDSTLENMISATAKEFYLEDDACPINYEPGGSDFLSPCLEEIDLMQRILSKETFMIWLDDFLPQLKKDDFEMKPAEVSDREDGYLVHLDGLNFSRAWVFYDLAEKYPSLSHLKKLGDKHFEHSFPNLINDTYEGGHWLGTFAVYALKQKKNN